eukprot:4594647-Prymnesium_polylepis.1
MRVVHATQDELLGGARIALAHKACASRTWAEFGLRRLERLDALPQLPARIAQWVQPTLVQHRRGRHERIAIEEVQPQMLRLVRLKEHERIDRPEAIQQATHCLREGYLELERPLRREPGAMVVHLPANVPHIRFEHQMDRRTAVARSSGDESLDCLRDQLGRVGAPCGVCSQESIVAVGAAFGWGTLSRAHKILAVGEHAIVRQVCQRAQSRRGSARGPSMYHRVLRRRARPIPVVQRLRARVETTASTHLSRFHARRWMVTGEGRAHVVRRLMDGMLELLGQIPQNLNPRRVPCSIEPQAFDSGDVVEEVTEDTVS